MVSLVDSLMFKENLLRAGLSGEKPKNIPDLLEYLEYSPTYTVHWLDDDEWFNNVIRNEKTSYLIVNYLSTDALIHISKNKDRILELSPSIVASIIATEAAHHHLKMLVENMFGAGMFDDDKTYEIVKKLGVDWREHYANTANGKVLESIVRFYGLFEPGKKTDAKRKEKHWIVISKQNLYLFFSKILGNPECPSWVLYKIYEEYKENPLSAHHFSTLIVSHPSCSEELQKKILQIVELPYEVISIVSSSNISKQLKLEFMRERYFESVVVKPDNYLKNGNYDGFTTFIITELLDDFLVDVHNSGFKVEDYPFNWLVETLTSENTQGYNYIMKFYNNVDKVVWVEMLRDAENRVKVVI